MSLIVVTGPESSGKTTLAHGLSSALGVPCVGEYARTFLSGKASYAQSDLLHIARQQVQTVNKVHAGRAGQFTVVDTYLLVIKIWSEQKFGTLDPELLRLFETYKPDLYLLCAPDIPWEYDSLRESKHDRTRLFNIYKEAMDALGTPYLILHGTDFQTRCAHAMHFIETTLAHTAEPTQHPASSTSTRYDL